jgi:hypothetical protein
MSFVYRLSDEAVFVTTDVLLSLLRDFDVSL